MLKSHDQLYSKAICESLHVYAATNATLHDFSCSLMCFEGENSLWSKPKLTNDLFNSGEFIIIIMQFILRLHSLHYFKAERVVSLSHLNHHVPCRVWILEIREHIWDSIEANHKNLWRAWKCVHFHTDTHTLSHYVVCQAFGRQWFRRKGDTAEHPGFLLACRTLKWDTKEGERAGKDRRTGRMQVKVSSKHTWWIKHWSCGSVTYDCLSQ